MNSEILNRWGEDFLDFAWPMLWQSSALIALVFILDLVLRRKVRAAVRHALWLVVLVKLILPPALALPTSPSWWIQSPVPPPAKLPPASFTVSYGDQMTPIFAGSLPAVVPPKQPAVTFAAWALVLSSVASSGLFAWLLFRWLGVTRTIRDASGTKEFDDLLNGAAHLAGWRSEVRLKLTGASMSPAVCGLFRPVILLPQSLTEKLSTEQLRAVLLHELIHLRRGDVWVNCVQALLQIVYWWHPLLWLANARIRRVREEAVDDAVMLALRDDAEIYAPTLLEVAKFAFHRPLASLGLVGILESRSALRQRIERLMDFNAPRKAGLTIVSILGILVFSVVALPMGQAPEKTNAEIFSPGITSGPTNAIEADKLVQDGSLLYEIGKFDDAKIKLKAAIALNPDNQAARYYLNQVEKSRQAPKPQNPRTLDGNPTNHGVVHTSPDWEAIYHSPDRKAIYHKLNSIRLESVTWSNGIALTEAIRFLAEQSRLHDPDKKGVNISFNPNVGPAAAPGIDPATGMPVATAPAPEVVDIKSINVKLIMKDVSLYELLDAMILTADHSIKYSIQDWGVVFSPHGPATPQLEMRVFKIDPVVFYTGFEKASHFDLSNTNHTAEEINTAFLSFFKAVGADLTTPGRSVAFNRRLSLLFVKATPSEIDTIMRTIQALMQVPPLIHVKAYFIEVPKDGFVMPQMSGTTAAGQMTGILTSEQTKNLLHSLVNMPGAETLAEPEVVTTSGRQTQMRATNQTGAGPGVDLVPYVLSDGYTICLQVGVIAPASLSALVNIYDHQAVVLSKAEKSGDKQLIVLVTATVVDPAGNRVHSEDELPFKPSTIPPQPR